MIVQPFLENVDFFAITGQSTLTRSAIGSTNFPLDFSRGSRFVSSSLGVATILESGRYSLEVFIDNCFCNTGGFSTSSGNGSTGAIELLRNSNIIAEYKNYYTYSTTRGTYTKEGFSFFTDSNGNNRHFSGTLSSNSILDINCRLAYYVEDNFLSGETIQTRISIYRAATINGSLSVRLTDYRIEIKKLS